MVLAKGADTEMGSYSKQLVSFAYHKESKQEDVGIYWNLKKNHKLRPLNVIYLNGCQNNKMQIT